MANGQPGFGDSLFKLASQRQAALSAEQARKSNQDNLRRKDINTLSGFDAASIEGDQQRAIFEEAVADVQSYISGTGEYEDAQYDPVNFKKQLMKINSVYNGFKAHGAGDVETAREALYNDAYTAGGVAREGGELGTNLMSNNNPSSYDEAVANHNNYFETARTANGKTMFDENGHPMGYPVVDGEVDRSAAPVSLFKMNAYANPESFRGNTVEVPSDTTLDMVQDETYVATLNAINKSLEGVEGKPLREVHDIAVSKLFDDKFSSAGQSEFRETLLIDLVREGKFPSNDKELQQAFINGEFDNTNLNPLIKKVRDDAEKIYADRSFDRATQAAYAGASTGPGSEDSPFSSVQQWGLGKGGVNTTGGEHQIKMLKDVVVQEGSKFGDYSITGVGVNGEGKRVATIMEIKKSVNDITGEETEISTPREIVITDEEGGLGREIYDSLRLQDPRILGGQHQDWINMNKALKVEKQEKEDARRAEIKAIMEKNEGMSEAKAAQILDAGGQEAFDAQELKQGQERKIARAQLELKKINLNELSSEKQSQIKALEKDLQNNELASEQMRRATNDDGSEVLEAAYPSAPEGATVAEMAADEIRNIVNNLRNAPMEGDLDKDGQVGLKEGEGSPGYKEYEAIDPYNGEVVKGYEAFWLITGKNQPGYNEPERFRLQREDKKKAEEKQEITSKPVEAVTPEVQEEYDATQEKLRLEERERLKALELKLQQEQEIIQGGTPDANDVDSVVQTLDSDETQIAGGGQVSSEVTNAADEMFSTDIRDDAPATTEVVASVDTSNVDNNQPVEEQSIQILGDLGLNVPESEMKDEIREIFINVLGKDTTDTRASKEFDSMVKIQNDAGNPDVVPSWCAAFVSDLILKADPNYVFPYQKGVILPGRGSEKAGTGYMDKIRAQSYMNVGEDVPISDAKVGDIVVKKDGTQWHVGIYAGTESDGSVKIFGANQNDTINVTSYEANLIQGVRRINIELLSPEDIESLSKVTDISRGRTSEI